jgi:hypothetical protein
MEDCLFCLEPVRENHTVNPPGCSCKIVAHEACIHTWYSQKQSLECPICHTVVIENPIPLFEINEAINQVIQERRINQAIQERRINQANQKVVAGCCFIIMAWVTSLSILEYIYHR